MWLHVHERSRPKRRLIAKVVPSIARHLLQWEVDVRNSLWHANIAAICGAYVSKRSCTLVMQAYVLQLATGGICSQFRAQQTLLDHVTALEMIDEQRIVVIMRQLLSALQHMHKANIAHMDLRVCTD